jgi:hypothetical protein
MQTRPYVRTVALKPSDRAVMSMVEALLGTHAVPGTGVSGLEGFPVRVIHGQGYLGDLAEGDTDVFDFGHGRGGEQHALRSTGPVLWVDIDRVAPVPELWEDEEVAAVM